MRRALRAWPLLLSSEPWPDAAGARTPRGGYAYAEWMPRFSAGPGPAPSPMSGSSMIAGLMAQVWPAAGVDANNVLSHLQASGLPSP